VPSANVTVISVASATTWRLVRMSPAVVTTTPLPSPLSEPVAPFGLGCFVSISTSDGLTAA
jgi:hypothetical protein